MCVIIILPAGSMMPKEALFNAVYNNPHSYGLIMKDGNNRVSLQKQSPDEVDPEVIYSLLSKNIDVKRYLHLRWATRGGKNIDNAQFFEVYSSAKRQIFFGHNGTLDTKFGGMKDDDPSDTKDFADKVVSKSLLRWNGGNGKADYLDPDFYPLLIKPQWTTFSKGILVSNDLDDFLWGPDNNGWTNFTVNGEKTPIMVSNTDYFTHVTRGPEKERREAKRREEEAAKRAAGQSEFSFRGSEGVGTTSMRTGGGSTVTALNFARDLLGRDKKAIEAAQKLFEGDITTAEGLRATAWLTREEWEEIVRKAPSKQIIELLLCFGDQLDEVMKENEKFVNKIERMQKHIDSLAGRIDDEDAQDANVHTVG